VVARSSVNLQKAMDEEAKNSSSKRRVTEASRAEQETAGYRERVYQIVRRIPMGRVMTYGQIAELLGEGYTARTVGYAMHAANEETVPWQRVINSQGACSTGRVILPPDKQQRMLEAEGIEFDARGRCDLGRYRWTPDDAESAPDEEQPSLFTG
jgi:methylated-DNA-protein-cysteine methyltransferase-like protein